MQTRAKLRILALAVALPLPLSLGLGCRDQTSEDGGEQADDTGGQTDDEQGGDGDGDAGEPPGMDGEGPAEHPKARQIARLSADQFHAALQVATGQSWPAFPTFAAALGKPDLAEVTDEGKSFSVSFDKFVHDAARVTCRAAVDADLGGELDGAPVILRHAQASDRSPAAYVANLQYLLLRFLAIEVDEGDPRLDPWLTLLEAPPPDGEELDDARMADRWWAVCVGLATHPDFLSY